MITVLSPAKKLSSECVANGSAYTRPVFLDQSKDLLTILKSLDPVGLQSLMGISQNLSELNWERFQSWTSDFSPETSRQAAYSFKGDTYNGLDADTLSEKDMIFSQDRVRILSGLYGLLKPLDLMLPYRLEMGTKLDNKKGKNYKCRTRYITIVKVIFSIFYVLIVKLCVKFLVMKYDVQFSDMLSLKRIWLLFHPMHLKVNVKDG